jgi:hypothetical protein
MFAFLNVHGALETFNTVAGDPRFAALREKVGLSLSHHNA